MSTRIFGSICFIFLTLLLACTSQKEVSSSVINLAIWNNYLSPELQKKFTDQTGIQIKISNYSSNEELLTKLQNGGGGIDLAVPSDYMVEIMSHLNLLWPLEKNKISNISNISKQWLGLRYDPQNTFSLPYAWSTTGIAYNTSKIKKKPNSWKDFYTNNEYTGKISLLDDMREVLGSALKFQHHSLNSTSTLELQQIETLLVKLKPRLKSFQSDIIDSLLNEEVWIAQSYSTDALQASEKSKGLIQFILPEEGGTLAVDNMVIPQSAQHKEAALQLMNFLLTSDVNVNFVKTVKGGPVLSSTAELLPEELKKSSILFPKPDKLKNFEFIQDLKSETKKYDEIWTRLKLAP